MVKTEFELHYVLSMAVVSAKLLKNIEESAPKNEFVEISIEFFCPALHYFLQICLSWSCCNPVIGSKVLKNHNNRLKLVRFGAFFVKFRADFFECRSFLRETDAYVWISCSERFLQE